VNAIDIQVTECGGGLVMVVARGKQGGRLVVSHIDIVTESQARQVVATILDRLR
jgi:hypothetical protein